MTLRARSLSNAAGWTCGALTLMLLTACGGGGGGSGGGGGGGGSTTYSVGGSVSGLSASSLVLTDNGGDNLTVASGASTFTFATKLASGASYSVAIGTQPTGETCTVSSAGGTVSANVTSVVVTCTVNTYTVAGTITGLTGSGLQLQDYSGGETLSVAAGAKSYQFTKAVPYGTTVNVMATAQPVGQSCAAGASNFSGSITSNVTSDVFNCGDKVTTFAGSTAHGSSDGTGAAASFHSPSGVAMDSSGNIYVADSENDLIRKITSAGVVTTLAGTAGVAGHADGTGTSASFSSPAAVAVDSADNVYVADYGNNEIRKITSAGVVTTFAGQINPGAADGTGIAASFYHPSGVALDPSGQYLYVADTLNNEIRKITTSGAQVTTLAGSGPTMPGSADGLGTAASFNAPKGVAVDSSGNIYVADTNNNEIRKVDSSRTVTTPAGSTTQGSADGTGSAASFNLPSALAVDAAGNVYVADSGNNEIRMVTTAGVVTTLAGSTTPGSADGTGAAAQFNSPGGIVVDSSGNLFVGDFNNNEIRKLAP